MSNRSDNFYSQSGLIKLEDGKEYRKRLYEESQRILSNLLDVLPSVYNATTASTNYGAHLNRVAVELARLSLESKNIQADASLDTVRPEYLYQKFGYQVQVNNTFFPTADFSDEDYRRFLKAVLHVLFNGATRENIQEALSLFAKHPILVTDSVSKRGVIQYNYITNFDETGVLKLFGTKDNISLDSLKLSSSDDSTVYSFSESGDYYNATLLPAELIKLRKTGSSTIPSGPFRVRYDYRDSIVDQFKLKIYFDLAEVRLPNKPDDILQKIKFILQLIKPAHVLADVRVYQKDSVQKQAELFTLAEPEEVYLALDEVVEQRFNSNQYDDFKRFTRNKEDTQVIEFNNIDTVLNKISEKYNDVGFYFNEPDPLYKKKYNLYQLKGFSAQSSSLSNSPYDLEFNKEQANKLNNFSYFDQTRNNYTINWPEVSPNTDLPNRDTVSDPDAVKVTSLSTDFGVSVSAGSFYSYTKAGIFTVEAPIEVILPPESVGKRTYIFIDLSDEIPAISYYVSDGLYFETDIPNIPLALVDVPDGATLVWDHYIRDLRVYHFINLTLAGDTSGFSDFNTSHGTVLGAGTRPIQFKFDDNQGNDFYTTENLNELNSTDFTLNESFVLGVDVTGYTADDTHFVFSGLEAEVQPSPAGSLATPFFEGDFALGFVFGGAEGEDSVHIFSEDTTFIFNDTLPASEFVVFDDSELTVELTSQGILWESVQIYNRTTPTWLVAGLDFTYDSEANTLTFGAIATTGDELVVSFYHEFGTLLNEDLLYGSNTTYATFDFNVINADAVVLVDETQAQIAVTSVVPEYFGVPITGIVFNEATVVTGEVLTYGFPTGIELILNDFTSLLNQPAEEVTLYVPMFDETEPSLISLTPIGPIEQLALEGVSIIDQGTGLPVIAFNGEPVT